MNTTKAYKLIEEILNGKQLDAKELTDILQLETSVLCALAHLLKYEFSANTVELCAIINARSGACPEDCSFCAQSSKAKTSIAVYPLVDKDVVLQKAHEAKNNNVSRFCIVTSGRRVSAKDLKQIASMIAEIRNMGLQPCATLGLLAKDDLLMLKEAGLQRYHHNLETSRRFFPEICQSHSYDDKLKTLTAVKEVGLSLCCGGIFGMGETWQDRIDMALTIRELDVQSVPINFLIPISGTKLQSAPVLSPTECLKIIALFRLALPKTSIRVCAGRIQALAELHPLIFFSGADAILTGNYLTTLGRTYSDDLALLKSSGLTPQAII